MLPRARPTIGLNTGSHGGFATQGILGRNSSVAIRDIRDGASNTLLLGEISWMNPSVGSRYRSWIRGCDTASACGGARNVNSSINTPSIATFNDIAFGSQHVGGANFVTGDGAVKFLTQNINLGVFKAAASRNGSESVALD